MKKHKVISRSIKILSLLLVLACSVWLLQEYALCHGDHNRQRIKGFYLEDKNSLDVVLIGASEVYAGYSACHAYEEFGFTSYPMAVQSNMVTSYKHQIKEIMKNQNPKLILVEVNGALYSENDNAKFEDEGIYRNYSDHVPLSLDKVEYIQESAPGNKLEYYLPIVKYHSQWKDFPDGISWNATLLDDQIRGYTYLKGTKCLAKQFVPTSQTYNTKLANDNTKKDLSEISEKYLRDLLEYCKEEGLDNVAFIRFPHIVVKPTLDRYYRANKVGDIINEYGFDYINLEKDFEQTKLNMYNDFYDYEHLNVNGQLKLTEYIGNLAQEKYGVTTTPLTDEQKAEWDESVKYYHAFVDYNRELLDKGIQKEIGENYQTMKEVESYIE